jgi:hypothetical protein
MSFAIVNLLIGKVVFESRIPIKSPYVNRWGTANLTEEFQISYEETEIGTEEFQIPSEEIEIRTEETEISSEEIQSFSEVSPLQLKGVWKNNKIVEIAHKNASSRSRYSFLDGCHVERVMLGTGQFSINQDIISLDQSLKMQGRPTSIQNHVVVFPKTQRESASLTI